MGVPIELRDKPIEQLLDELIEAARAAGVSRAEDLLYEEEDEREVEVRREAVLNWIMPNEEVV